MNHYLGALFGLSVSIFESFQTLAVHSHSDVAILARPSRWEPWFCKFCEVCSRCDIREMSDLGF
jgi:hypothetical protein